MVPAWLEHLFYKTMDLTYALIPQATPPLDQLKKAKIISHRGERDNKTVYENTFDAFDPVLAAGVYGIELDVCWSKDDIPMVFHDHDLKRLFSNAAVIADLTAAEIQAQFPLIPTLQQLVERYGKKLHLMIELKQENRTLSSKHNDKLQDVLAPLTPRADYHLISLQPEIFQTLHFAPNDAYFPIAQISTQVFSDLAVDHGYAGLLAHYALVSRATIQRHLDIDHSIGTGHIASRNCLYREINRGVEWIFTNSAVELQSVLNAAIQKIEKIELAPKE